MKEEGASKTRIHFGSRVGIVSPLLSGTKTFFGDQKLLFRLLYFSCVKVGRPPGVRGWVYFYLSGGSFWLAPDIFALVAASF